MKKRKLIVLGAAGLLGLSVLAFFGLQQFVRTIYNQRSCEWANIDNLEMHAKVDVPTIIHSACTYDEKTTTKMAYFELDKSALDVEHYIDVNHLSKIDSLPNHSAELFHPIIRNSPNTYGFFYKSSSHHGESAYVLFDPIDYKLWVTIAYRPAID